MIDIDQDDLTISINRVDPVTQLDIIIPLDDGDNYMFQAGDVITLRVYDRNGYTESPKLEKSFTLEKETEIAPFIIDEEDTNFAPLSNQRLTYWYDISLNERVIIGFDEDGAKKFIVNPAKGGND